MKITYKEIMSAEMHPDVYGGPKCDQIEPLWWGSADGDKDGPGPIGEPPHGDISLRSNTFPPGTRIRVEFPECPECGEPAPPICDWGNGGYKCNCGFDWKEWTEVEYS